MVIDGCQLVFTHFDSFGEKYFISIRTLFRLGDSKTNQIIVGQEIGNSIGRAIFFNIREKAIVLYGNVQIKEVDPYSSQTRETYNVSLLSGHEIATSYYNIANIVAIPMITGLSDRKVSIGVHSIEDNKWVNRSEVDIHALQEFKGLIGGDDPIYGYL